LWSGFLSGQIPDHQEQDMPFAAGVQMGRPKRKTTKAKVEFQTIGVRGTSEWVAWLEKAARHFRTDVSKLIDSAVAAYARDNGFTDPPPDRT
jgi:hypothetical protein